MLLYANFWQPIVLDTGFACQPRAEMMFRALDELKRKETSVGFSKFSHFSQHNFQPVEVFIRQEPVIVLWAFIVFMSLVVGL